MQKGEKLKVKVSYDKKAFSNLSSHEARGNGGDTFLLNFERLYPIIIFIVIIIFSIMGGGGRRILPDIEDFMEDIIAIIGGCAHSNCACAHSSCASSCACACAGSGRAGCSKKDFYGTNLNSDKIKKAMKN